MHVNLLPHVHAGPDDLALIWLVAAVRGHHQLQPCMLQELVVMHPVDISQQQV